MGHLRCFESIAVLFLCIFLVLLNMSSIACDGHMVLCKAPEREALLHFKDGLSRHPPPCYHCLNEEIFSSWDPEEEEDCCKWVGIGCNNRTGHVTKLILPGTAGNISHSLADLRYLQHLDLSSGDFFGSSIPAYFGSFKKLRYLDLTYSNFSGVIPPQLGNLSSLQVLKLSNLYLKSDGKWLSQLLSLQYLGMCYVNLTGATSLFQELNMLPSISYIDVSSSDLYNISLSLSSTNFTRLSYLDLSYNERYQDGRSIEFGIPEWIFNLTSLEHLYLQKNGITNIQKITGNLCNLRTLSLFSNNLMTSIDDFLKGCDHRLHLEELDLSYNQIIGQLPSWLGEYKNSFKRLKILKLNTNSLYGPIPESISGLKSLMYLDLSDNEFDGHIPMSIGGLTSCIILDLSFNNLNGTIPSSMSELKSLIYLYLSGNSLQGIICEEIFHNLTKLKELDFSENSLEIILPSYWDPPFNLTNLGMASCKVGPSFPLWLQTQHQLSYVNMSNSSISGVLPRWIWNLSSSSLVMDLSLNMLSGMIPVAGNGSSIGELYLDENKLEGSLSSFPTIEKVLRASNNFFSSSMNLGFASELDGLELSRNNISGTLPSSLCNARNLKVIDFSNNHLSGELPSCSGNFNFSDQYSCSIQWMHFSNNSLQGTFPTWLKNCSRMVVLDVGDNKFTGNIPNWIARSMPDLQVLILRNNLFYGSIPPELASLESLQVLDLGGNSLSGPIPLSFSNLTAMKILNPNDGHKHNNGLTLDSILFNSYKVYIEITLKGQDMGHYDVHVLFIIKSIDLSNNKLSGEIPQELGELRGLISLNLSCNYLTGRIPESFSNLTQLDVLDLSRNNLSGGIPQSLVHMTFLNTFNVSFNNLSGPIPVGN